MHSKTHAAPLAVWIARYSMLAWPLICGFVCGCDGPPEAFTRGAVQGTVTLDGQPLNSAIIRFVPTGSTVGPKTEFPVNEGEFTAVKSLGPPVGAHRVEIDLIDQQWQIDDEEAIAKLQKSPRTRITRPTLPERYHRSSTLTATIEDTPKGEVQTLTFPLSTRP
jgi:hypothetical protein